MTRTMLAALAAALTLGACGAPREPDLLTFQRGEDGPEEFAIVPNRPLAPPEDYAALPAPTPGGANRADLTPLADAAALGGDAGAGAGGIRAADAGLVTHAARGGVDPAIRAELAAADLEIRRGSRGRFLERLFSVNIYNRAYEAYALDKYAELERWRRAGVRTPSAPPDPAR